MRDSTPPPGQEGCLSMPPPSLANLFPVKDTAYSPAVLAGRQMIHSSL